MATPAAILQVLLEVESTKATAALRRFDSSVARTGTSSKVATGRTTALNKATSGLGSSLGRAARYAAGAAVAYMSIAQAKAAVTVTQDLAKTSAGLNRNLGLTTKTASRWGTVAKARDIDTKSLNMSFTTLSRRLVDVSKGSDTAIDSFKDIGITQRDIQRTGGDFNQQLLLVADAFGKAEGGAVRQQAAQKLLGRGYQTLLPMFAEGSKSLEEQMMWADRYGTALDKQAVAAQMRLVNAQRESKVAMLGLQVSFTKFVTPALREANKEFQHLSSIMANKNLTQAERFKKVGAIIGKWGEKAFDAFIAILPKMAETAGEQAPKIAAALAKGFLNADVWGKVFLSGWLFAKLGGAKFFTGQGKMAGRLFAGGFILALPTLITEAFDLGKKVGNAVRDALGLDDWEPSFGDSKAGTAAVVGLAQGMPQAWPQLRRNEKERSKLIEAERKASANRQQQIEFRNVTEIDSILETGFGDQQQTTKTGLDKQEQTFQNTKSKLNNITKSQAQQIAGNVGGMVNAVGEGLKTLGNNTNKALQAFGVKKMSFAIESVGKAAKGFRRGGHINTGASSGDTVPAMLERGEYVLNRNAVSKVGRGNLDRINSAVPRFASGGVVEALAPYSIPPFQYDANHAGGNSHMHIAMSTSAAVVALGRKLQQMGMMVGEHPAFGGVGGMHAPGGYHYSAQAIDVNTAANETRAEVASVARLLGGGGFGGVVKKLKRILLDGPAGPLRSMGQGALDKSWKAAQGFLNKQMPSVTSGNSSGVMNKAQIASVWGQANKGQGNAGLMAAIALAESSGNPAAVGNDPGGTRGLGLWQITTGFNDDLIAKYGGQAGMFNPFNNAKAAGDLLARQGLGAWVVYNTGAYQQYLQRGGMPSLDRGGRVTQSGLAQVHPGDVHMGKSSPNINVYVDPVSLDVRVESIVEGMAPEIAEFTARQLGRGQGRSRQLSRG